MNSYCSDNGLISGQQWSGQQWRWQWRGWGLRACVRAYPLATVGPSVCHAFVGAPVALRDGRRPVSSRPGPHTLGPGQLVVSSNYVINYLAIYRLL